MRRQPSKGSNVGFLLGFILILFSSGSKAEEYAWYSAIVGDIGFPSPTAVCKAVAETFNKLTLAGNPSGYNLMTINSVELYNTSRNGYCYLDLWYYAPTSSIYNQYNRTNRYDIGRGGDGCGADALYDPQTGECFNTNRGVPACPAGTNPINIMTGYKYQHENNFLSFDPFGLIFASTYIWDLRRGTWTFDFQQSLEIQNTASVTLVDAVRPDSSEIRFSGSHTAGWEPLLPGNVTLHSIDDGAGAISSWELTLGNDQAEEYDVSGQLRAIRRKNLPDLTFYHTLKDTEGGDNIPTTLDKVEDTLGNTLSFTYDDQFRVVSATASSGNVYRYAYNANGMLQYVSYPDDTSSSGSNPFNEDNPYREYHYEDANFPNALTGITDANGSRFATWSYDSSGRATSSEHNNGADLHTIDYTYLDDATDPRTTVTNALGKQTTYHFTTIHGVRKVTQVEGHQSSNCAAANKAYTYDANGFLASKTDWQGNTATYTRNAKGQELSRTEAEGTPEERTITTEWHPTFNLPTKITESGRETVISYDANGNELSRTVTEMTP